VSLQTTMAQGAARDAESAAKLHRAHCTRCGKRDRCAQGRELATAAQDARAEARRQAAQDRAPIPGQGELDLFGSPE
jgi:hypothetical protein